MVIVGVLAEHTQALFPLVKSCRSPKMRWRGRDFAFAMKRSESWRYTERGVVKVADAALLCSTSP